MLNHDRNTTESPGMAIEESTRSLLWTIYQNVALEERRRLVRVLRDMSGHRVCQEPPCRSANAVIRGSAFLMSLRYARAFPLAPQRH